MSNFSKGFKCVLVLALCLLPSVCLARWFWQDAPKPSRDNYVMVSYGTVKMEDEGSFEDENRYYSLAIGKKLTPHFGVELSYSDFGEAEDGLVKADFSGFSTSALGYIPIGEYSQFYLKLGVLFSTLDIDSALYNDELHDEQPHIGLGFNFKINDPLTIFAEINRYSVKIGEDEFEAYDVDNKFDVDTLNVGFKILF